MQTGARGLLDPLGYASEGVKSEEKVRRSCLYVADC